MGLSGLTFDTGGGSDEDTQTLSYKATTIPTSAGKVYKSDGTTEVNADDSLTFDELKSLKFLPATNVTGDYQFTFTVTDTGSGTNSTTETLNIKILPFNDIPELPATITLTNASEDPTVAYVFTAADLLNGVTDPDIDYDGLGGILNLNGNILAVSNLSSTNGTISDLGGGNYTFTPDSNFNGVANFNYLISDGQGGSISNSINLTVNAVNDAPVATFNIAQYITEGSSILNGQLTATDIEVSRSEVSVDTLKYYVDGPDIAGLAINEDNGSFTLILDAAYNSLVFGQQVVTVSYLVKDLSGGAGFLSGSNSFTITITGSNDTPVAQLGLQITLNDTPEDSSYTIDVDDLLQGFTDPDTNDDLYVQSPAVQVDESGVVTDELAGSFSEIEVSGVVEELVFYFL